MHAKGGETKKQLHSKLKSHDGAGTFERPRMSDALLTLRGGGVTATEKNHGQNLFGFRN